MQLMWSGNITFKIEGKEVTYTLETIGVEQQGKDVLDLKITTRGDRAGVAIPLSRQDCKKLVGELIHNL